MLEFEASRHTGGTLSSSSGVSGSGFDFEREFFEVSQLVNSGINQLKLNLPMFYH